MVKLIFFTLPNGFLFQCRQHLIQQRQHPAALEEFFGCETVSWLHAILSLGIIDINGKGFSPTAALFGASPIPLIGQKMFASRQEKRAEFSFLLIDLSQELLFQQPGEETLSQILRILGREALPTDEDIQGIPINAAESSQRF